MPDILSKVTCAQNLRMTKVWKADGTISPYDNARHFRLTKCPVANIHELSALLGSMVSDPHSCIIRGRYVGTSPDKDLRRKEVYEDQPLHTMLAEIDNAVALDDYTLNPVPALDAFISANLPEAFHSISYFWSLSCSAGHPSKAGKLKAHVWFWLETPYTTAQMSSWIKRTALDQALDSSVFRIVQAHYTSAPVFEGGVIDPVPVRFGFEQGLLGDAVPLNLSMEDLRAVEKPYLKRDAFTCDDPRLDWLADQGLILGTNDRGHAFIECPFADGHSTVGNDSSTAYLPKGTDGHEVGNYRCLHASCGGRLTSDFDNTIGYTASQFDALPDPTAEESAQEHTLRFQDVQVADFAAAAPPDWIIEDVLLEADLAMLFGASGSGKTFAAIDLAFHIARGKAWQGKDVKQGRVVYVCAEGAGGARSRFKAYQKHHNISDAEFAALPITILADRPSLLDKKDVAELVKTIKARGGCALVIVDTLAQATAGGDENSGKDMSPAIEHCQKIKKDTGAMVLLVHHTGKDEARGSRGWSGWKGALDCELEIKRDGDVRNLRNTKNKDGEDGAEWGLTLVKVPLGVNAKGREIFSCIAEFGETQKAEVKKRALGHIEVEVLDALDGHGALSQSDLVVEVDPEAKDGRRDRIIRAAKKLVEKGLLVKTEAGYSLPSLEI